MITWFKNLLTEKLFKGFIMSYVGGYIERLKGYKFFTGLILTILQVAAAIAASSSPEAASFIHIIINAFGDTANGLANPNEIGIVATSLLSIWALAIKAYKAYKGVPQVPTIVIPK